MGINCIVLVTFLCLKFFKIKEHTGNSLAVQWLGLCTFTAKGAGSIPGQGTEIPQAVRRGEKNPKNILKNKKIQNLTTLPHLHCCPPALSLVFPQLLRALSHKAGSGTQIKHLIPSVPWSEPWDSSHPTQNLKMDHKTTPSLTHPPLLSSFPLLLPPRPPSHPWRIRALGPLCRLWPCLEGSSPR